MGTAWIVAGLLACGAEMLVPGVFLLPVGAAAVLTGLGMGWGLRRFGLGDGAEWLVFSVLMLTLVSLAWRVRRVQADAINGPQAGLIGAQCHSMGFSGIGNGAEGRVTLGDGAWPARLRDGDGAALEIGTALRVVGLDGTTLLVARALPL